MFGLITSSRIPAIRLALTRVYSHCVTQEAARPLSEIPGPKINALFLIAHMIKESRSKTSQTLDNFLSMHKEYGPIYKTKIPGQTFVTLHDPEDIKQVLSQEGKWPERVEMAAWLTAREDLGEEKGVLLSDGEAWQRMRSSVNKHMMRPRSVASHTDEFRQVADDMVARLAKSRDADQIVPNIREELFKWSFESGCTLLLERRLGILGDDVPPDSLEFIRAAVETLSSTEKLFLIPPAIAKPLRLPIWKTHLNGWETLFRHGKKYIDEVLEDIAAKLERGEPADGLIASMVAAENLSQKEIYAVMIDLMTAAVDTTSNTTCLTLDLLSREPEIQETLYKEITSVAGTDQLTFDHIKQMPYLKAVVKETLRLYPVSPSLIRNLQEDIVVRGYHIPAKTSLVMNFYAMARDPSLFPDPERFMPERWLRGQKAREDIHPYSSLPFGFGPRACVGRRIAELEAYLLIVSILRQFHLTTTTKEPMQVECKTLVRQRKDPAIQFKDRQ